MSKVGDVVIYKAGAIILSRKNPLLVALLYRSRQNDWSFPKGHIEKDESAVEAAEREVLEETGLLIRLIGEELPLMEYKNSDGDNVAVHMFLAQSEDDNSLKTEFDGDKIVWVPYKKVVDKLTYNSTGQYYRGLLSRIENTIKKCQK